MFNYKPIEESCPDWPEAWGTINSLIPPCLTFAQYKENPAIVGIDVSFAGASLRSVPLDFADSIREVASRLNWIASRIGMTLPTQIELSHLTGRTVTDQLIEEANKVLYANDLRRFENGEVTSVELIRHGLGIAKAPFPLDPDWI